MDEKGLMYAAFHRFYGALQNLQKFSADNNLLDNITSLDSFFLHSGLQHLFFSVLLHILTTRISMKVCVRNASNLIRFVNG